MCRQRRSKTRIKDANRIEYQQQIDFQEKENEAKMQLRSFQKDPKPTIKIHTKDAVLIKQSAKEQRATAKADTTDFSFTAFHPMESSDKELSTSAE